MAGKVFSVRVSAVFNNLLLPGTLSALKAKMCDVIDVNADAGAEMGIFESLPDDVNSSNELVHAIRMQLTVIMAVPNLPFSSARWLIFRTIVKT